MTLDRQPRLETERLVLATERYMNSRDFKLLYPEAGEDIKVMGFRRGKSLDVTAAVAFVDRYIDSEETYFARKERMQEAVEEYIRGEVKQLDRVTTSAGAGSAGCISRSPAPPPSPGTAGRSGAATRSTA